MMPFAQDKLEQEKWRVCFSPALADASRWVGAPVRLQFVDRLPSGRYDFDGPGRPRQCWGMAEPDGQGGYTIKVLNTLLDGDLLEVFHHELAHVLKGHLSRLRANEPEQVWEREANQAVDALMRRYGW